MGSHSVTCHPAAVTFPPYPMAPKLVLDFATPEGCKAELTLDSSLTGYHIVYALTRSYNVQQE